ncbi:MAG: biopolymer transporter ExbD [Nostocales cyanobacterium]|nr:MAG: biopolymer transporter ExbD [Nostocales cyanobacterium]TAF08057.1 MAG: biopolymer transporter ExbD [Nostocales cyanobacterium]
MKVNLHTPIEEVQIQIIPLIDVVFCILTFFLLAAVQFTRQQAINIDLPKASTGTNTAANSRSEILPVTIDALGKIFVEKDQVSREELQIRLKQYVETNPNGILVLNASRTATYNDVIETLDLLRQVGGNRVSLGIIPGAAQQPTNLPDFSIPPVGVPIPNTVPIPGSEPQNNLNPAFPLAPTPFSPSVREINPGISPVIPNTIPNPSPTTSPNQSAP